MQRSSIKMQVIHLLIDNHSVVPLVGGDSILVVGRDDRTNKKRASLQHLMKFAPKGYYTILMDHQPYHLEEAQQAGIDFQLSATRIMVRCGL